MRWCDALLPCCRRVLRHAARPVPSSMDSRLLWRDAAGVRTPRRPARQVHGGVVCDAGLHGGRRGFGAGASLGWLTMARVLTGQRPPRDPLAMAWVGIRCPGSNGSRPGALARAASPDDRRPVAGGVLPTAGWRAARRRGGLVRKRGVAMRWALATPGRPAPAAASGTRPSGAGVEPAAHARGAAQRQARLSGRHRIEEVRLQRDGFAPATAWRFGMAVSTRCDPRALRRRGLLYSRTRPGCWRA